MSPTLDELEREWLMIDAIVGSALDGDLATSDPYEDERCIDPGATDPVRVRLLRSALDQAIGTRLRDRLARARRSRTSKT